MSTAKKIEEQRRQEDDAALRFILSSRQGRSWVLKHINDCGFAINPFSGQREVTDFNCGRQSVAQDLLVDINRVSPGSFALMLNESQMKEEANDHASSTSNGSTGGDDGSDQHHDPRDYNAAGDYDPLGAILR